ncbi:MAG: hypothetical protein PHW04_04395 [Candidatus Wallbacteria bacterium]|nr:hypothetical protein [Candidatus Wallbacteria bacterium]
MKLMLCSLLTFCLCAATAAPLDPGCRQVILVLSRDWSEIHGRMFLFDKGSHWTEYRGDIPVTLGRSGLGWGLGLHPANLPGPEKREGDGRAPAGIFSIGDCMGYAPAPPFQTAYKYVHTLPSILGIDDPESQYYNQIIDTAGLPQGVTWKSFETMRRDDILYKWLFVVNHNPLRIPQMGSLIFIHIWRGSDKSTSGCTAMCEYDMLDLMRWLDRSRSPLLVQMPVEAYQKYRKAWKLPDVKL